MARIPSRADVAALSREEWEDLCRALVVVMYDAEGVEDRRGKGNGLDMIRIRPDGAYGWQFRRFDHRFEDAQAAKVFKAIELACRRCEQEDKVTLVEFTLWANIDLEPGHKTSIGERERFFSLAARAEQTLGVRVQFVGITWVWAQLLLHPLLRPDLFEDVPAQIASVKQQLEELMHEIRTPTARSSDLARMSNAVKRLVEQATIHFERGLSYCTLEQFQAASGCFKDALALMTDLNANRLLEGRILIALATVEQVMGNLSETEAVGRRWIDLLKTSDLTAIDDTLAILQQDQQCFVAHQRIATFTAPFTGPGMVARLIFGNTHVLVADDATGAGWDALLRRHRPAGDHPALRVPHHGSWAAFHGASMV